MGSRGKVGIVEAAYPCMEGQGQAELGEAPGLVPQAQGRSGGCLWSLMCVSWALRAVGALAWGEGLPWEGKSGSSRWESWNSGGGGRRVSAGGKELLGLLGRRSRGVCHMCAGEGEGKRDLGVRTSCLCLGRPEGAWLRVWETLAVPSAHQAGHRAAVQPWLSGLWPSVDAAAPV